jgi:hypothetical protein
MHQIASFLPIPPPNIQTISPWVMVKIPEEEESG